MAALVPQRDAPARRRYRAPWSPRAWAQALYLTGGIPVLLAVPLIVAGPAFAVQPQHVAAVVLLLLPGAVVAVLAMPLLGRIHRHRLRTTAGVVIPPQPFIPNGPGFSLLLTTARSPVAWRLVGYYFLAAPALGAFAVAVLATWLAGLLYTFVYVYAWALYPWSFLGRGQSASPGHLAIPVDVYLTAGGSARFRVLSSIPASAAASCSRCSRSTSCLATL